MSPRTDEPEPLAAAVAHELARVGRPPDGGAGLGEILGVWPQAVGEAVARNAWPARLSRDGTLVVHASSSTWAFELTQLEATIRERLGPAAPSRLRFVVGPLPEPDLPVEERSARPAMPPPEALAQGASVARGIENPELRALVARAAAAAVSKDTRSADATGASDRLEQA